MTSCCLPILNKKNIDSLKNQKVKHKKNQVQPLQQKKEFFYNQVKSEGINKILKEEPKSQQLYIPISHQVESDFNGIQNKKHITQKFFNQSMQANINPHQESDLKLELTANRHKEFQDSEKIINKYLTGKNKSDLMTNSLFPTQKTFTAAYEDSGSFTRTGREQQRGSKQCVNFQQMVGNYQVDLYENKNPDQKSQYKQPYAQMTLAQQQIQDQTNILINQINHRNDDENQKRDILQNDNSEVEEVNENIKQLKIKNKKDLNESISDKLAELTQMNVNNLKSKMKKVRPGQSSIQCINTNIFLDEQSSELVMQGTPLVQYQYTERINNIPQIQNKKISQQCTDYINHQLFATTNLKLNPIIDLSDSFQSIGGIQQQSFQQ